MGTRLVILDQLAKIANSRLVKDVMIVHYRREIDVTFKDVEDLMSKASQISARVDDRDQMINELQLLCGSDSSLHSINDMMKMQTQDLAEVAGLLLGVAKRHARLRDLFSFLEKLVLMEI